MQYLKDTMKGEVLASADFLQSLHVRTSLYNFGNQAQENSAR